MKTVSILVSLVLQSESKNFSSYINNALSEVKDDLDALLERGWFNPETQSYQTTPPSYDVPCILHNEWLYWVRSVRLLDMDSADELMMKRRRMYSCNELTFKRTYG